MFANPLLSLLLVALAASPARAEIYACTGKGRMPVYQNFPCRFDRLEAAPPSANGTTITTTNGRVTPERTKNVASSRASAPRVGMTTDEVRAIWGEPRTSSKEEHAKRDIEVWTYADSRSIEFDRKGVVTAIHW